MLRLLNFSFNGGIHFFLLQKSKSAIGFIHFHYLGFVYQCPFRFRKHKGHDLAYDVKKL